MFLASSLLEGQEVTGNGKCHFKVQSDNDAQMILEAFFGSKFSSVTQWNKWETNQICTHMENEIC